MKTTIAKRYREGLRSPFEVRWRVEGKYRSRYFENENEQDDFAEKLEAIGANGTADILSLEKAEILDILRARGMKKDSVSFTLLAEFWNKHHKERRQITLWNAADIFLKTMKESGERSIEYLKHVQKQLEFLCENFGETLLENIERSHLDAWLNRLPYGAVTKRNYRSGVRAAWSFFEKQGWVDEGGAARISVGKAERGEIGILTVEEAEKIMRALRRL